MGMGRRVRLYVGETQKEIRRALFMSLSLKQKWGNLFGHSVLAGKDVAAHLGKNVYHCALNDTFALTSMCLGQCQMASSPFLGCLREFYALYLALILKSKALQNSVDEIRTEFGRVLQAAHQVITKGDSHEAFLYGHIYFPDVQTLLPEDFVFSSTSANPGFHVSTEFSERVGALLPAPADVPMIAAVTSLHATACGRILKHIDELRWIQLPVVPIFGDH